MKPDTNKQIWGGRTTDWTTLLMILGGIILGSAVVLGPLLSGIDAVNQKFVLAYHCPGAIDIAEKRGPIVQVGSDPNSFGQTVEGICTFSDGSTKVVSNDEYAVTTIVGSLILGAILGVGIAVIFTPMYILRKRKATKVI
jgi:Ca2+/Na+ antiporter